ncbi:hypothetical protein HUT03_02070, partial [Candidatus Liberibacter africanus]
MRECSLVLLLLLLIAGSANADEKKIGHTIEFMRSVFVLAIFEENTSSR